MNVKSNDHCFEHQKLFSKVSYAIPDHISTKGSRSLLILHFCIKNRRTKLRVVKLKWQAHRKTSQQQSRPWIGAGNPSLAKRLRYTGPLDGLPSLASFAFSTSTMKLFCAITVAIPLKNHDESETEVFEIGRENRESRREWQMER